jgi:transposase
MGKQASPKFTDEFKREAVRILLNSERALIEVAEDLGIKNKSTLGRWKREQQEADLLAGPHDDVQMELKRLRRENELLRQERDILKKATALFAKETRS